MTTLRKAVEMALEALEDMLGWESLAPQSVQDSSKQSLQRLREALAQPEPEPVGYMPVYELSRLQNGHDGRLRSAKFGASALDGDVAVYVAPPQRKPLTDDEVRKLWDSHTIEVYGKIGINPVLFARYLEREYWIGEKE